jgi:hypothetical protein
MLSGTFYSKLYFIVALEEKKKTTTTTAKIQVYL